MDIMAALQGVLLSDVLRLGWEAPIGRFTELVSVHRVATGDANIVELNCSGASATITVPDSQWLDMTIASALQNGDGRIPLIWHDMVEVLFDIAGGDSHSSRPSHPWMRHTTCS